MSPPSSYPTARSVAAAAFLALAGLLATPDVAAQESSPLPEEGRAPAGTLSSTAGEPTTAEMTGIEAAEVGVLKFWFERLRRLEAGDAANADLAVSQMEALMDREGIRGMEVLAGAFAHEGYSHLRSGNYLSARESFALALRFDPTLPSAYFGLAKARRLAGEGVVPYFEDSAAGGRAATANFWFAYTRVANALFLLLAALAAFAVLFGLLVTARHQAKWRHDLAEYFQSKGFSEGKAKVAAMAVFLGPLLLWLGGVWLLFYWMLGTFRYMGRTEKSLALVLVLLLLAAVPAMEFTLSVFRVTDSPTVKAAVSALKGGYEPEKVSYIKQILQTRADDPRIHFLLASVLKDGGNINEAFRHYKLVIELDPEDYRAYNNIGNIYFLLGQYGEAVNWYRRATDLRPDYAIAYFNANLAQKEQLHFTEADQSLDRARSLDPGAVADFLERKGELAASSPVDDKIPMSEAWVEVVRGRAGSAVPRPASQGWFNPITAVGSLTFLGMLVVGLTLGRRPSAENCSRCGRAYCGRCGETGGVQMCPQCTQLMLRKDHVAPELRHRKQRQVARWERWSRVLPRMVSAVVPGGGQILGGWTLWGSALAFAWIALWLHLLLGDRLLAFVASPYSANAAVPWGGVVGLGMVWLLGLTFGAGRLAPPAN